MTRFVLIDHSISDFAGHHYQYALHVLRAAERAGYDPILVTNRKLHPALNISQKVYPLYEFGFWSEPADGAVARPFSSGTDKLRRIWFGCKSRMRYSALGLAWLCRFQWLRYLACRRANLAPLPFYLLGVSLILCLKLARSLVLLGLFPLGAAGLFLGACGIAVKKLFLWMLRIAGVESTLLPWARRGLRILGSEAKTYYEFLRLTWQAVRGETGEDEILSRDELRQARAFRRDTERLLQEIDPGPDDIFFLPTISPRDLLGLGEVLNNDPAARRATWHLLFRRNVYAGTRGDYSLQEESLDRLRRCFQSFQQDMNCAKVRLYTDTEELAEQYDRLGIFRFDVLPIPHTCSPEKSNSRERPLRVTYLGDARREKGFHLLPDVVTDLTDYLETGRVQFVVQCNFNSSRGEPEAAVARCRLESLPPWAVLLHKEPLSSQDYQSLLLSADINLLLYDPANYYARSSGILVESLSAGIPVIVPSRTWLARQFLGPYYRHQESLRERMDLLSSHPHTTVTWRCHGNSAADPQLGGEIQAFFQEKAYCWLDVPYGATHILLTVEFGRQPWEACLEVSQLDWAESPLGDATMFWLEAEKQSRRASVLVPLLRTVSRIWCALRSSHRNDQVCLRMARIDFLRARAVPIGSVGLIYHHVDEIAGLVREMIDHYAHYRVTATEFARQWHGHHNSDSLVGKLLTGPGLAVLAEPSFELAIPAGR